MHKQLWRLSSLAVFLNRPLKLFLVIFIVACMFVQSFLQPTEAAETGERLLVGAAAGNITPWLGISINGSMRDRKATHIHDQLYARCLVLDNGSTRVAIVVCDSCLIPREIFDQAKQMVQEHTGLQTNHMLMAATHTHFAPTAAPAFQSMPDPEYRHFLTVRIADTVRCAIDNLVPGRIGWGVGRESKQVFNRRWHMKPGTIPPDPFGRTIDQVKMNPKRGDPNLVKPAGPTDPDVTVISLQSVEGRPLALLANYTLHYVGGTDPGHVSADYFGMFANRIRKLLGADLLDPPFVGILTNGASADVNNIDFRAKPKRRHPYEQMGMVTDAVASEAFRVVQKIQYHQRIPLTIRQAEIQLSVRRPGETEVRQAENIVANLKGKSARTLEEIYAKETIDLSKYPDRVELIIQAMRIGEVGMVAIPCEVFVEIGLELKKKSPFKTTFVVELANGYNGYLPTLAQHKLGGYETWRAKSSYLEVDAAPKIVDLALELLNHIK
ncbi:MAG: hypothetical protein JSV03_07220 [Planctomycetota bacterium]|nr:MAG: hypothetical protein JSV03_07220 [Planctomycetota bacterium]